MKNNLKHHIRTFWVGGAMGVANIIPGVSGGTLAVVFGIYEELMQALGNFVTDKENRWKYIRFLSILFSGSLVAILGLAPLLSWSFKYHPLPKCERYSYFDITLVTTASSNSRVKELGYSHIVDFKILMEFIGYF